MKGFYITCGVFTDDLDSIVKELEDVLALNLIKSEYIEDDEIYYLKQNESNEYSIKHFSIHYGNSSGYHINELEILHPNYLISCNIILEDKVNNKIEHIQQLRNILSSKEYIKELNFDTDEW
ncbi:hypothetical protein [Flavobacterium columnare]|uniref:Uncharacterized protein n=1 Tax=Flavobacterium columnare TaxID=996 RepID=A0AA94JM50_9FLAO|nr:hypothetical protein [Flavobacterium columnare]MCH4829557.1 hypothetical protein [Flavobacterium columnare]MCH4831446.1 hypothetical protein [Flavobacterium columnare]